jgi:hypothetical protein
MFLTTIASRLERSRNDVKMLRIMAPNRKAEQLEARLSFVVQLGTSFPISIRKFPLFFIAFCMYDVKNKEGQKV